MSDIRKIIKALPKDRQNLLFSATFSKDIRRLAADLQRAQLSGAVQKLSERNCIELVSRLIKLQQIELIYTADGKEYLTPQQLQR